MEYGCCEWCQQEGVALVPIVNRNPHSPGEYELVCGECAAVEQFEHANELLYNPIPFELLQSGCATLRKIA
jgi:hypothetical protein